MNVALVEAVAVAFVARQDDGFAATLFESDRFYAACVEVQTGLACFVRLFLASLSPAAATHTSENTSFAAFKRCDGAVEASPSALDAACSSARESWNATFETSVPDCRPRIDEVQNTRVWSVARG
jgi:hypothetical protein